MTKIAQVSPGVDRAKKPRERWPGDAQAGGSK